MWANLHSHVVLSQRFGHFRSVLALRSPMISAHGT